MLEIECPTTHANDLTSTIYLETGQIRTHRITLGRLGRCAKVGSFVGGTKFAIERTGIWRRTFVMQ
jgi:hypothetical protein